jgi:HAD superfamily hydrolase (TIGR01509 family)
MGPPTRIEAILFDNDGVVVDSELLANQVLAELLSAHGFPCTVEYSMETFMGQSLTSARQKVLAIGGIDLPEDFEDAYHRELFVRFDRDLVSVPGVDDLLSGLTVPFAMASSGDPARIERALRKVGLWQRFCGHIYSAVQVEHGKPAPDLFLFAAAQEGWRPERCLVIEDSQAGVRAARAAQMCVIGFAARTPAERLAEADYLATDMAEVAALISTLTE